MNNDPKIFVMGDLHGAYKALIECLERAHFDYENDTLIQLGDVVDGNPQVYECVEELIKIKNLIAIKGNHDAWFQKFLENDFHPQLWNYGGIATLESYLNHCQPLGKIIKTAKGYKTSLNATDIPESHKAFFKNQLLYYIDEQNRCFVHAGFERTLPFFSQEDESYYFNRTLWIEALELKKDNFKHSALTNFSAIYIGHSATTSWDSTLPMSAFEIKNIDTGAGLNGRLTIFNVETTQFFQSDYV